MSKERRYNEKEIAAIFQQAAKDFEVAQQNVQSGEGLTLAEIEQIGSEVGITPEFIARAALKVDSQLKAPHEKKFVGLPTEVNRVVDLPDTFSDEDWDSLVVNLHDSFNIIGSTKNEGRTRIWTADNMYVRVEPTGSGYRLRINRTNVVETLMVLVGGVFFLVSMMFMVALMTKGKFLTEMDDTLILFIFTALGLGTGGFGAMRMPTWHQTSAQRIDNFIAGLPAQEVRSTPKERDEAIEAPKIQIDNNGVYSESNPLEGQKKTKAK